jgi:hypothetical protein
MFWTYAAGAVVTGPATSSSAMKQSGCLRKPRPTNKAVAEFL